MPFVERVLRFTKQSITGFCSSYVNKAHSSFGSTSVVEKISAWSCLDNLLTLCQWLGFKQNNYVFGNKIINLYKKVKKVNNPCGTRAITHKLFTQELRDSILGIISKT